MKKTNRILSVTFIFIIAFTGFAWIANYLNTFQFSTYADIKTFFKYSADGIPLVSSHRGGPMRGYPENCIETFEHTLKSTHSILEVDPHYTKDSMIVLMHDATLNRTSNGTGKVSDYTLKELKAMKLKDTEGNITNFSMPTLDEALQWAKGKTLLVLDMKDVPIEARVRKIMENDAENAAIVMAYSFEDAKKCYELNNHIVMEVMINTLDKVKEFDATGVPWENVVVFVSHNLPVNKEVIAAVHQRGAMCIIGTSRNYDKQFTSSQITKAELEKGYQSIIADGADVIEADLGIEAGLALHKLRPAKSKKYKFFK